MPIYTSKNISDYQKLGIWHISESNEELYIGASNLPYELIIPETKNENRIKQWITTRLLLNHFFNGEEIQYNEHRKPYLNNGWKISISHTQDYVAILLNEKEDCGIDIEKISPKVDRIKHKFLSASEQETALTHKELTIYWGAKEALYKYYGKKEVLFIENLNIKGFDSSYFSFKGVINMPNFKNELVMNWEEIEDHILVYTL